MTRLIWLSLLALSAACTDEPTATPDDASNGVAAKRDAVASERPAIDIAYEKHILPNGLTLILHEDHKAPVVAVNVWYHVGSKDERPGRTGFAHLFEHLMFNGSENHNDDWFRPLEAAGATKMNGTTWLDRTNYFQNVPTSALDLTLWMESDRMGHMLGAIDQARLDEQRAVVQNEKRQGQNRPYGKVPEFIAESTYPAGHPYSWSTIGSMEDLNAASLEDVREWFRSYYGAANAVLVIAGDIDPADAKAKVEHYFGDIPPGPVIQRNEAWVAKMSGTKRAMLQDRVPQARVYKVWNIPGYRTRDFALLDIAADVLAAGKNSRLYKRLVYTDQIATTVQAGVGPFELGSQLEVIVEIKPGGDTAAVEATLEQELARLLQSGPTIEELERIKIGHYARFVRGMERTDGFGGKSAILAESEVYGGSPDFYKQRLQWLDEATPEDVQTAVRQWLSDGVFVLEVQPTPDYVAAETGADRSKPPATGTPPELNLPPLERSTLSNGLEIVLAQHHNAPIVQFELLIDAGYAADSSATPGTAKLTFAMLDEGTDSLDALEIAARSETLGAQLDGGSTLDTSYVSLNALTAKLPESLALYADVLLRPAFPDEELARLKTQLLAAIEQEKTDPRGIAMRLFPRLIYGEDHPYGNPFSGNGTEESIAGLTREDLQSFYRRWLRPDNATLLIVGDTTLDEITPLLEKHFAEWKGGAEAVPSKTFAVAAPSDAQRVFLINRTGAEQSLIVAGYPASMRSDPDHIALQTLNTILGGSFTSRLNMNLREDKGWSYGARSGLSETQGRGPFMVQAPVQTDRTAEAIQEIVGELNGVVGARPPTAAELGFARDSLVLKLPGQHETVGEVANSFADTLIFDLPDTYWNDYVGAISALTPADLEAAAAKLIRPDELTWIVVGDLARIEESVRALGLGEVTVLDADGNVLR